jgi:two-component system nitrate/nitrite sensor histidine kinase NarX
MQRRSRPWVGSFSVALTFSAMMSKACVPGDRRELAVLVELAVLHAQQRLGQAVLAVHDLGQEIALDAVQALVHRRIGVALGGHHAAVLDADQHAATGAAIAADALVPAHTVKMFERRLLNLERFIAGKGRADSAPVRELQSVLQRWNTQIRALELDAVNGDASALRQMANEIPDFVDQIDRVVNLIEHELEERATWLRIAQLVLLALIVAVSLLTLWMLRQHLIGPLAQLLQAAQVVTQGSFSARVEHVGGDELGRLGQAFNVMVGEIANMYAHLEDKVEEKTRELKRTNQALELLYRVSQRLSASDLTLDQVRDVLGEVEAALELGQSMLCISENQQFPAHTISAGLQGDERHALCSRMDCGECFLQAQQPLLEQGASSRMIAIPIGDGDRLRGILPMIKSSDDPLSVEKARIIETVGNHISNALISMRRAEEKHRLAVMEERSVIARELHDSIAQSLSYLKIQVTRLERSLDQGLDPRPIADELRRGLAEAYRELRELIVTFRLRIDERGLNLALQDTVQEFEQKLGFTVPLHNGLSGMVLLANEELHVLRIVREALSNIERHAQASSARVSVTMDAFQAVTVRVEDDGRGFDPQHTPTNHFGVNIMNDRAMILAGRLEVRSAPGQGTVITLQFLPQRARQPLRETA